MKKLILTGSRGSAANILVEYLSEVKPDMPIIGICRSEQYRSPHKNVIDVTCDLTDPYATFDVFNTDVASGDCILHLASNADVRSSWDQPHSVINNNVNTVINILESLTRTSKDFKLVLASTSEVYGIVPENLQPITEDCRMEPINPYAVSKTTQDMLCKVYGDAHDIPIVRTRMFGYLNPYRENLFASSFARQVARVDLEMQKSVQHGNLKSSRTLIDHRDVASAYWAACEKGRPGEAYNIGSETPIKVGEVLEILKSFATTKVVCEENLSLIRPIDIVTQVPDTSKFRDHTGWEPKYDLYQSLKDLYDYWFDETLAEKHNVYASN